MKIIKKNLINCLLLLTVSSCSRYYNNEYMYTPPEDATARQCILICRKNLQSCENIGNKAYQECLRNIEQTSMLNYSIDLNTAQVTKNTNNLNIIEQCHPSDNNKQCTQDYNVCYKNCGGKVEPNNYSLVNVD